MLLFTKLVPIYTGTQDITGWTPASTQQRTKIARKRLFACSKHYIFLLRFDNSFSFVLPSSLLPSASIWRIVGRLASRKSDYLVSTGASSFINHPPPFHFYLPLSSILPPIFPRICRAEVPGIFEYGAAGGAKGNLCRLKLGRAEIAWTSLQLHWTVLTFHHITFDYCMLQLC